MTVQNKRLLIVWGANFGIAWVLVMSWLLYMSSKSRDQAHMARLGKIDPQIAVRQQEADRLHSERMAEAQAARDREAREARKAAAEKRRRDTPEAPADKVTRANYNRIPLGTSLSAAQDVLGPATENIRAGNLLTVSWSGGIFGPFITATFQDGILIAKGIN